MIRVVLELLLQDLELRMALELILQKQIHHLVRQKLHTPAGIVMQLIQESTLQTVVYVDGIFASLAGHVRMIVCDQEISLGNILRAIKPIIFL